MTQPNMCKQCCLVGGAHKTFCPEFVSLNKTPLTLENAERLWTDRAFDQRRKNCRLMRAMEAIRAAKCIEDARKIANNVLTKESQEVEPCQITNAQNAALDFSPQPLDQSAAS